MNPETEYIVAHDLVVEGVKAKAGTPLSDMKKCGGVWANKTWLDEAVRCGHLIEAPTVPVDTQSGPSESGETASGVTDDESDADEDDDPPEIDATSSAVKLAADHDIDLSDVVGTGVDGRITHGDVKALIE